MSTLRGRIYAHDVFRGDYPSLERAGIPPVAQVNWDGVSDTPEFHQYAEAWRSIAVINDERMLLDNPASYGLHRLKEIHREHRPALTSFRNGVGLYNAFPGARHFNPVWSDHNPDTAALVRKLQRFGFYAPYDFLASDVYFAWAGGGAGWEYGAQRFDNVLTGNLRYASIAQKPIALYISPYMIARKGDGTAYHPFAPIDLWRHALDRIAAQMSVIDAVILFAAWYDPVGWNGEPEGARRWLPEDDKWFGVLREYL
jgi:hypothetical protein